MDITGLKNLITSWLPEAEVSEGKQYLNVLVPAEKFLGFAKQLKSFPETAFDYLFCVSGVDMPDHILMIYHLESTRHKHQLVVKVKTEGRETPAVDSVSEIWHTAEFHEREVFDLLGIKFNHHPDLRRIFLEEGWGFPLRKDYVDEVRIVER